MLAVYGRAALIWQVLCCSNAEEVLPLGSGGAGVISTGRPDFYYVEAHQVNEASDTEN